jgi:hypothetical protein
MFSIEIKIHSIALCRAAFTSSGYFCRRGAVRRIWAPVVVKTTKRLLRSKKNILMEGYIK